jgi:hypothetical protein
MNEDLEKIKKELKNEPIGELPTDNFKDRMKIDCKKIDSLVRIIDKSELKHCTCLDNTFYNIYTHEIVIPGIIQIQINSSYLQYLLDSLDWNYVKIYKNINANWIWIWYNYINKKWIYEYDNDNDNDNDNDKIFIDNLIDNIVKKLNINDSYLFKYSNRNLYYISTCRKRSLQWINELEDIAKNINNINNNDNDNDNIKFLQTVKKDSIDRTNFKLKSENSFLIIYDYSRMIEIIE